VLIDEAYHHFVSPHLGYSSFLDSACEDPRVVVCRTFSKVYGLAGQLDYVLVTRSPPRNWHCAYPQVGASSALA
jgi:hypothetical protein